MTPKSKNNRHIDSLTLNLFHYKTNIAIRFSDLNAFGMVNSDVYLSYFEIAQSGYWRNILKWKEKDLGIMISSATVEYIHPVVQSDSMDVHVRIIKIDRASFIMEYIVTTKANSSEKICAIGHTTGVFYNFSKASPQAFPEYIRNKIIQFERL